MQLELLPRTSQEMYQGCWLLPNAVNLEQQNCLLARCREWGKDRLTYTTDLSKALKFPDSDFEIAYQVAKF